MNMARKPQPPAEPYPWLLLEEHLNKCLSIVLFQVNEVEHRGQAYGFAPECNLQWALKLLLLVKALRHFAQR